MKENLVISESKSGEKISEEAIREALSRILESAMFIQSAIARGVILSNDGIFEPGPLERLRVAGARDCESDAEDKVRREILVACQRANWKLGGPRGAAARLGLKRTTLF